MLIHKNTSESFQTGKSAGGDDYGETNNAKITAVALLTDQIGIKYG